MSFDDNWFMLAKYTVTVGETASYTGFPWEIIEQSEGYDVFSYFRVF